MENRWWIYQNERFPIFRHGFLMAAVCFGALIYSLRARSNFEFPDVYTLLIAFVSIFIFFLQLRIADEFKDYDDDLAYRPYRPVQRGQSLVFLFIHEEPAARTEPKDRHFDAGASEFAHGH